MTCRWVVCVRNCWLIDRPAIEIRIWRTSCRHNNFISLTPIIFGQLVSNWIKNWSELAWRFEWKLHQSIALWTIYIFGFRLVTIGLRRWARKFNKAAHRWMASRGFCVRVHFRIDLGSKINLRWSVLRAIERITNEKWRTTRQPNL